MFVKDPPTLQFTAERAESGNRLTNPLSPCLRTQTLKLISSPAGLLDNRVRKYLTLVNWSQLFHGLHLNSERLFDEQIQPISAIQFNTLVMNWKTHLPTNR